jgi:CRP-like cAMP-binding protein
VDQQQIANVLLKSLTEKDLALLTPFLERIDLSYRLQLEFSNRPIAYMVFPESGVVSVVAKSPEGKDTEISLIGYEGVTGTPCLLGAATTPYSTYVQIAGKGIRIRVGHLLGASLKSPELNRRLLRFNQSLSVQTASTVLANAQADAQTRLARWLLMVQDRVRSPELFVTHDLLAVMLGLRRPWVTETLNALQTLGLIALKRQNVTILDRRRLISVANGFYGVAEDEYKKLTR